MADVEAEENINNDGQQGTTTLLAPSLITTSLSADISGNGQFAVFPMYPYYLDPNDMQKWWDIFVYDRGTSQAIKVSVSSSGVPSNGGSEDPAISADGQIVVFASGASNLVPNDTEGEKDIFVHNRVTGETTRVSVSSTGVAANNESFYPAISADGQVVAFVSEATNLVASDTNYAEDVFVYDFNTKQTTRVSVSSQGNQSNYNNEFYNIPSLSADGRYVAFISTAANLAIDDTNRSIDVFVHDRQTGQTERVSVSSTGEEGNGDSYTTSISADGQLVTFASEATNFIEADTNGAYDVFVHDRQTDQTTLVSISSSGEQGNKHYAHALYDQPQISSNGRYVVFTSESTNLVANDTNGKEDVFVHDRQAGQTIRVSVSSTEAQSDGHSDSPSISADGQVIAFTSEATNLVIGEEDGNFPDMFVHERQVSVSPTPTPAPSPTCGNLELAERFAPHMYFHEDDIYRPIAIDVTLEHANLTEYTITGDLEGNIFLNESVQINAPVTFEHLNSNLNRENIYIDFLGKEPAGMREAYETTIKPKSSQLAYVRFYCPPVPVTIAPNVKTKTVIQYWFFYYDNPWGLVHHEGDWEMLQVMLDENDVPTHVGYSQHYKGSKRKWDHVSKDGTHPIVYVAEGSHASFFVEDNCNYTCLDDTSPVHTQHGVIAVSSNITPWINFKGHWGGLDISPIDLSSPRGPQYRIAEHLNNVSLWDNPVVWFLALPPDEDTDSNKVEKINISVPSPLTIKVTNGVLSDLTYSYRQVSDGNIPSSEYIDNPETGKRTFIIHKPDPNAVYTVTVQTEHNINSSLALMGLNLHFTDIRAGKNITAQYQFPPEWNPASVAMLKLHHDANFEMKIDIDNDTIIDQSLLPILYQERTFLNINRNSYLPLIIR